MQSFHQGHCPLVELFRQFNNKCRKQIVHNSYYRVIILIARISLMHSFTGLSFIVSKQSHSRIQILNYVDVHTTCVKDLSLRNLPSA